MLRITRDSDSCIIDTCEQALKWNASGGSGGMGSYVNIANGTRLALAAKQTVCTVGCDVDADGEEGTSLLPNLTTHHIYIKLLSKRSVEMRLSLQDVILERPARMMVV